MKHTAMFAAALAACLAACNGQEPDVAANGASEADNEIVIQYSMIEMYLRQGDYSGVRDQVDVIHSEGAYPRLSSRMKYQVDNADGTSAFWLHMAPEAHAAFLRMTRSPFADTEAWRYRLESAKLDNDFADAYTAFLEMRKREPDFTRSMEDFTIHVLDQGFGTLPTPTAQRAFEQHLEDSQWRPIDPNFSRDVIWWHYAINLDAAGDHARSQTIARRIGDAQVVIAMRADKRFDALVAANPTQFDVRAETEAAIGATRSLIARDPADIGGYWTLAVQLLNAGHAKDAVHVLDNAATAAAQLTTNDRANHPDAADQYDQLLGMKAYVLFDLGHTDEALGVASSVGAACHCGVGTDMVLETAALLVRLDRGQEALDRLRAAPNDKLTFEAQAMAAQLRACAATEAGDTKARDESLAFLLAHADYAPVFAVDGLLCAKDIDGAAKLTVAGLADPRSRGLYLHILQIYLPPDVPTAHDRRQLALWTRLRERADVAAAVDQVGRIGRYDIRFAPLY